MCPIHRRDFIKAVGLGATGISSLAMSSAQKTASLTAAATGNIIKPLGSKLKVQPSLIWRLQSKSTPGKSYRSWGGILTEQDLKQEIARIEKELSNLAAAADFPVEFLPIIVVQGQEDAQKVQSVNADVNLIYAAGLAGSMSAEGVFRIILDSKPYNIMFLRHKSGPIYQWYEIVHPALLRDRVDNYTETKLTIDDVVVDEYADVLWRLRSLYGLKNTLSSKLVYIDNLYIWGGDRQNDIKKAIDIWKLDIKSIPENDFVAIFDKAMADKSIVEQAQKEMDKYLTGVKSLHTEKEFVLRAFVLKSVLKQLMAQNNANAITMSNCMSIGEKIKTTACLAFSLVNDDGQMAFCEGDMAVIPSGILLRHIANKPVFLQDPTLPHHGIITFAHCTAPRRMNGKDLEPAKVLTHCESDYGAAPKVLFKKGQVVTNIVPSFNSENWLGFTGKITDAPSYHICRSQMDISIDGDWKKLLRDMKGFHWMTCYGDYIREAGYAVQKVGIKWEDINV